MSIVYDHHSRPPLLLSLVLGLQHLLVLFGGVVTAPLILALAMNLPPEDVRYLISSSLFISGIATLVQIQRFGVIGSGLLSVQGTSFTFIGPLIFCFYWLTQTHSVPQSMGILFGSSALCAVIVFALCPFIKKLSRFITTNVTGATVILIGISLVWSTLSNLYGLVLPADGGVQWLQLVMAAIPCAVILICSCASVVWLRMLSVAVGLCAGYVFALSMGAVDFSGMSSLPGFFVPEFQRYPMGVDWVVVAILLPVFIVSMSESIGDFTVTSSLSGLSVGDKDYWLRIRGGLFADTFNSFLAALFSTFPNTTFSQNNGVIRLTGVASPYVGRFVALFLILLGGLPWVAGIFQTMPQAVLFGGTLLMFAMVGLSGLRIVSMGQQPRRDWLIVCIGVAGGYSCASVMPLLTGIPEAIRILLQFPVSTGAMIAVIAEQLVPVNLFDKRHFSTLEKV